MRYYIALFVLVGLVPGEVLGQIPDSIGIDSLENLPAIDTLVEVQKEKSPKSKKKWLSLSFLKKDYPNPKTAFFLSAALPGAGQVYNKKLWYLKVPIIYAGMGLLVYNVVDNRQTFVDLRDAYKIRVNGGQDAFVNTIPNTASLRSERDRFQGKTDKAWLFLIGGMILQAGEAFVQAHLLSFDVSEDLSLQLVPIAQPTPDRNIASGCGIQLMF